MKDKKERPKSKTTISEIKHTQDGINGRLYMLEEIISELDTAVEAIQNEM